MSSAWGTRVDPLVPEESRWHSSQRGPVTTPDAIGDALVATLREAAREADDEFIASVVAFCGLQVAQQLVEYERESRLLAKLADTGRVVTVLLQAARTAAEVAPAGEEQQEKEEEGAEEQTQHVSRLTQWRRTLVEERARRMEQIYEPLLSDDAQLTQEMGDETQQLEILTLLNHETEMYEAVLTVREMDVINELYTQIIVRSDLVVVVAIPFWFETTASWWTDSVKTVMAEIGEGAFVSQVSIWKTLRHPNVLRFYGACHVGQAFVIHEAYAAIPTENLSWKDLLGLAAGIGYVHERGFAYQSLSMDTFVWISSEQKLVVSGMGLVRSDGDGLAGELQRAADVMSFGLVILDIFQRTRGDGGGDQTGEQYIGTRQLPASKPDSLNDPEWEMICSMCSVTSADRPSMTEVMWRMRNLITLEKRDLLEIDEKRTMTTAWEYYTQYGHIDGTASLALQVVDQLYDEDPDKGVFYRSVSDRLANIYQQIVECRETVLKSVIYDFAKILANAVFISELLGPEMGSNSSSKLIDSTLDDSSDWIRRDGTRCFFYFHLDLDRLMDEAPDLLHTSQLRRWRHLLRQEVTGQPPEEIVAAWEEKGAHDFNGDVIDARETSDGGQDALGAHFLETLRKKEQYTKNAVAVNFLRRDVKKKPWHLQFGTSFANAMGPYRLHCPCHPSCN